MDATEALSTLVPAARAGDPGAWDAIVARFQPLIDAVVRKHGLGEADGRDASQEVWVRVFEHLGDLREPQALPGWIRTTAAHECVRVVSGHGRERAVDPQDGDLDVAVPLSAEDAVVAADGWARVTRALAELPRTSREVLLAVVVDPSLGYREVSERLGIPVGSIGPTRARALDVMRRSRFLREALV
jgi:RNA polymerase sigma factor (sigma-70 family)